MTARNGTGGLTMNVNELLQTAFATPGIVAAMVVTRAGGVVAMQPASEDPKETTATARWASAQVEVARGICHQANADEFLLPHNGAHHNPHTHVTVIGGYFLLLVFATEDSLRSVEALSRAMRRQLAVALSG